MILLNSFSREIFLIEMTHMPAKDRKLTVEYTKVSFITHPSKTKPACLCIKP